MTLLINMVKTVTELLETVRSLKQQHHQPQVTMVTADKGKSKFSHSEAVNCQLCGRHGHTAHRCRLNEKSSGQNVRCFNCHRFGHKAYQCHLNWCFIGVSLLKNYVPIHRRRRQGARGALAPPIIFKGGGPGPPPNDFHKIKKFHMYINSITLTHTHTHIYEYTYKLVSTS